MERSVEFGGVPPPAGCIYEGTLTKKALLAFPAGSILVGNGFTGARMPSLIRVIPPVDQKEAVENNVIKIGGAKDERSARKLISSRELIWTMVKRGRWNGLKCYVFRDRESAKRWVESVGGRFPVASANT